MSSRIGAWIMVGAVLAAASAMHATPSARSTEGFRKEHAEIKEHLEHLHQTSGLMAKDDAAGQRKTAQFVVKFLKEHIVEHAKWEEEHLYPVVDKLTHAGEFPFTGSMRYEHRIIGRWIGELEAAATAEALDPVAFTRKTDRVLGLITAHFEEEEEVLLPILDARMTREEVEKELGMNPHR